MSSFRRSLMMAKKRQKPEYTELEYIESTGTQYIDTGYMINYLNKIEFKIQDLILSTTVSESFFGAGDTATNNIIALYLDHNHQCLGYRINSNGYNDTQIGDTGKLSGTPTVTIDNGNIVLNNRNNEYSYNYKNIQCYTNRNCYIFARNQGDRIIPKSKVKLCYFKIWDNNALIRDFIPVLDKNNVPCLYDKVERKYYYNQGTGEFLYKEKSKLPDEYQEVECIESTGSTYLELNQKISSEHSKLELTYQLNGIESKNNNLFYSSEYKDSDWRTTSAFTLCLCNGGGTPLNARFTMGKTGTYFTDFKTNTDKNTVIIDCKNSYFKINNKEYNVINS